MPTCCIIAPHKRRQWLSCLITSLVHAECVWDESRFCLMRKDILIFRTDQGKISMDREYGYTAKFVYPLLDRHLCSICKYPMKNPMQTECGHLFCRACLEPVLRGLNPLCPIESSPVSRDTVRTLGLSCHAHSVCITGGGAWPVYRYMCPFFCCAGVPW